MLKESLINQNLTQDFSMIILGIHDGHNSGATLLKNGVIVSSILEERITRTKNEVGYPENSINEVLKISNVKKEEIDFVCYSSNFMHSKDHLQNISDWYNVGVDDQRRDKLQDSSYKKVVFEQRKTERINQVVNQLKCSSDKIRFYDHHTCHAAAAYYGSHYSFEDKVLVLTVDGAGDGLCSTVSIGHKGKLKRIASTDRKASLGKIYSRITYLLGFKPWEHEYKIMGMSPYADKSRSDKLLKIFEDLISIDKNNPLVFTNNSELETNYIYQYLKEKLERARFDEVSRAIQTFTENLVSNWVNNCINETKINKVALGGGVFMNVKANQIISNLKSVEDIFVFPSCGDESLSLGACWLHYYRSMRKKTEIKNIYLGGDYSNTSINKEIEDYNFSSKIKVEKHREVELEIAKKLSENKVVARFSGKMEWGARALGNRSILANPSSWQNVEKINSMIKMRDFWMPFAPSIIFEDHKKYLINEKNLFSPYMMLAYDTTKIAEKEISAAVHPRDKTARAQLVTEKINPKYHLLIKHFKALTGISAVLNTSFNLHGYPLVYKPKDALYVFDKSGLDYLAINDYLISKQ
jgi:carbamoyltransferase|tara:strand:+ start:1965 stop:3710 length:1746 start_codon:yes stop_codon:yes gene_type:complete